MEPKFRLKNFQPALLQPVDLSLQAGETLVIHGASGTGKTLFLRAICDLDQNQGEAYLDGEARSTFSPQNWRKQAGYLPAESHWWDETVADHAPSWDQEQLRSLGFSPEVLKWQTSRLSSGERQRLSLLRLLSNNPEVLLLDEPTANLDQENTLLVEKLLQDYQQSTQACMIWVSHSREQRQRVGTRFARMENRQLIDEGNA